MKYVIPKAFVFVGMMVMVVKEGWGQVNQGLLYCPGEKGKFEVKDGTLWCSCNDFISEDEKIGKEKTNEEKKHEEITKKLRELERQQLQERRERGIWTKRLNKFKDEQKRRNEELDRRIQAINEKVDKKFNEYDGKIKVLEETMEENEARDKLKFQTDEDGSGKGKEVLLVWKCEEKGPDGKCKKEEIRRVDIISEMDNFKSKMDNFENTLKRGVRSTFMLKLVGMIDNLDLSTGGVVEGRFGLGKNSPFGIGAEVGLLYGGREKNKVVVNVPIGIKMVYGVTSFLTINVGPEIIIRRARTTNEFYGAKIGIEFRLWKGLYLGIDAGAGMFLLDSRNMTGGIGRAGLGWKFW